MNDTLNRRSELLSSYSLTIQKIDKRLRNSNYQKIEFRRQKPRTPRAQSSIVARRTGGCCWFRSGREKIGGFRETMRLFSGSPVAIGQTTVWRGNMLAATVILSPPLPPSPLSLSLCHFRSLLFSLSFLIPSLSLSLCAHETSARTCTQPGRRFSLIHGSVPLAALLPDGSITDNNRVEALPCKTAR